MEMLFFFLLAAIIFYYVIETMLYVVQIKKAGGHKKCQGCGVTILLKKIHGHLIININFC